MFIGNASGVAERVLSQWWVLRVLADGRQQKWSNNREDVDDDDKEKDNVPMNCRETNHASAINGKETNAVSKI